VQQETEMLKDLFSLLNKDNKVGELPKVLMREIVDLVEPDLARYYIRQEDGRFRRQEFHSREPLLDNKAKRKFRMRNPIQGAIGQAVRTREIVRIIDPDKAIADGVYDPIDGRVTNEIVVPILARHLLGKDQRVVAIFILSRFKGNEFSKTEYELIEFASSIINAIYKNGFELEQKERRIEFFSTVTSDLASSSVDDLFQSSSHP
jgi:hypothetical protein